MKLIRVILLALAWSVALSAQVDTTKQDYYMYIYFINANGGEELGARIAFSNDGINWQQYNNGDPVIVPKIAEGAVPLMRDPNTYYDSTTGLFHLTWTTAWTQTNVGYATSSDLIHWSDQIMIPVGKLIPNCACCWAPEFFYDDKKDSIMLYWSTERGKIGKEAFCSMTKDFRFFSTPRIYFAPKNEANESYSIIDETLLKVADGKYYLFFKDERKAADAGKQCQNIHYVTGPTPQGPWWKGTWDEVSDPISAPGREGPTACIFGNEVRVLYDPFLNMESTDRSRKIPLSSCLGDAPPPASAFTAGPVMKTATGDFLPSHGSISKVPRAKVLQVLYGIPDPTKYPKKYLHPKQEWMFVGEAAGYKPNPADTLPKEIDTTTVREYPMGRQNIGCGTGFGVALLIPIGLKGASLRRRMKKVAKK
jgi:hypothetical protein